MQNILLIDDDKNIHDIISEGLPDYKILHAYTGQEAIETLNTNEIDAAICDLVLPDLSGIDLIKEIKHSHEIPIIVITGYASIESAIKSIKAGADDYLKKPFSLVEVDNKLKRILKHYSVINENMKLKTLLSGTHEGLGIVYVSQKMDNIMQLVKRIASYDINVLIQGESGVGKEVIARAIHKLSARKDNKFVAINCSGIPETLLESELFGYVKGAFTGASGNKKGLVEVANNGTLFLDEIGDASPEFQVKVLRMIDTGTYTPIGSTTTKQVNVRIVSATNKNINSLIENGKFREDLYYRISGITLNIPPLRERKEDIPVLASYYLKIYSETDKKLSNNAIAYLMSREWKGNVRELIHTIQKASILSGKEILTAKDFELGNANISESKKVDFKTAHERFEQEYFSSLFRHCNGNVTEMARISGLTRQNIYLKIKKYSIKM